MLDYLCVIYPSLGSLDELSAYRVSLGNSSAAYGSSHRVPAAPSDGWAFLSSLFRAHFTYFYIHFFSTRLLICFSVLFHSCCSHAQVLPHLLVIRNGTCSLRSLKTIKKNLETRSVLETNLLNYHLWALYCAHLNEV